LCDGVYVAVNVAYDIDRFECTAPRFSPRQSRFAHGDWYSQHKLSPVLKRVYEQMSEPKWVMAFGACAASGGFYDNYATVRGLIGLSPSTFMFPAVRRDLKRYWTG
jgi:NADH-quinone oxidoreductase subunit B